MAKSPAGKRRLLLVLLMVAAGLVAARSARRKQTPPFPPAASEPASVLEAESLDEPVTVAEPEAVVASVVVAQPEPDVDVLTEPTADDLAEPAPATPAAEQPELFSVRAEPVSGAPAPGPFPGSVLPLDDGSAPSEDYLVKGNANSMRSHGPRSPYYGRTRAEVWFRTERDAVAAGFRPYASKAD
ncbi:MAG TPA: hypothetical protein VH008_34945 [Pseudonocardia sp.]|nr:hypothetical protein [Pseudonocardia sp.]